MNFRRSECPFEADVLEAVSTRRWPDRVPADLAAHAATCEVCADVVTVAAAFESDLEGAPPPPRPPDATVVWLRAQMRARFEAERTAARPITVAQAVGLAALVGVAGAVFGATTSWFQTGVGSAWTFAKSALALQPPALPPVVVSLVATHGLLLAGGLVLCLIAAPLAVYLTVRED
jgi:hypothetical protein